MILSEEEANQIVQLSGKIEAVCQALVYFDADDLSALGDCDFMQAVGRILQRTAARIGKIGAAALEAIERRSAAEGRAA